MDDIDDMEAVLLSPDLKSILHLSGARIRLTKWEHVAAVKTKTTREETLGYIKITNRQELDAFEVIRVSQSQFLIDHVVLPEETVEFCGHTVVYLPYAGEPLLSNPRTIEGRETDIAVTILRVFSSLHQLHIAHLDIKPDNLIWDSHQQRLRVIDFDSSVKLHAKCSGKISGQFGTTGYAAPEVETGGPFEWDAYLADAWSCGRVLLELFGTSGLSEESRFMWSLAEELTKFSASRRWSIETALGAWKDWMEKRAAIRVHNLQNGSIPAHDDGFPMQVQPVRVF